MKIWKITSAFLLSLGLIACQFTTAFAASAYTYTVRFYAGAQGTFKEGDKELVIHKDLQPGQRVTFNQRDVQLNDDSKYYVKGIRESGKDNNRVGKDGTVEQTRTSFEVDGDQDYVVVYGLLTDKASYTVNYVDADGRQLAPSETYYGNVGDAPVIAYLYIEGYQPQAYNLTGVLQKDDSKNVFNFVYSPIDSGAQPPAATTAPTAPTTDPGTQATIAPPANPAPGTTTTTTTTGGQDGGEAAAEGEEGGEDAQAAEGEDAGAEGEEGNEPAELEQIGDEEVPLANMGNGTSGLEGLTGDFAKRVGELPFAAKVGVISAVILGLGAAAWFLLIRDRKKQIDIE